MKKVSLIRNFYNGDIGEGSTICNELTIEFKEKKTKIYISRYYYGANIKHAAIVGEVNLFDLYKDEYVKVIEEYQTTINQMTSTYKEEYFQNKLPDRLASLVLLVDDREYRYANMSIKDNDFTDACDYIINSHPFFKYNNEELIKALENKPYKLICKE
jgi:hypothetical protein